MLNSDTEAPKLEGGHYVSLYLSWGSFQLSSLICFSRGGEAGSVVGIWYGERVLNLMWTLDFSSLLYNFGCDDTDRTQIDAVPRDSVIFISSHKALNAVYGGLMTHRARASGAVGTIVDGRIRDLAEHREQKYPVS